MTETVQHRAGRAWGRVSDAEHHLPGMQVLLDLTAVVSTCPSPHSWVPRTPSSCRTYRQLMVDGGGKTFFRASDGSEVLILPSVNLSLCKPPSWAHWSPNEQKSANTQRREENQCGWERARGRTWRVPKYINKHTHENIKTKPIIMYN